MLKIFGAAAAAVMLSAAGAAHADVVAFDSGAWGPGNVTYQESGFAVGAYDQNGDAPLTFGWYPEHSGFGVWTGAYTRVLTVGQVLFNAVGFSGSSFSSSPATMSVTARLLGGGTQTANFNISGPSAQAFAFNFAGPVIDLQFTSSEGAWINDLTVEATTSAVPEPATWAMLIAGFGLAGAALRRVRDPAKGRALAARA